MGGEKKINIVGPSGIRGVRWEGGRNEGGSSERAKKAELCGIRAHGGRDAIQKEGAMNCPGKEGRNVGLRHSAEGLGMKREGWRQLSSR